MRGVEVLHCYSSIRILLRRQAKFTLQPTSPHTGRTGTSNIRLLILFLVAERESCVLKYTHVLPYVKKPVKLLHVIFAVH